MSSASHTEFPRLLFPCLSARCATAANSLSSDLDVFRRQTFTLRFDIIIHSLLLLVSQLLNYSVWFVCVSFTYILIITFVTFFCLFSCNWVSGSWLSTLKRRMTLWWLLLLNYWIITFLHSFNW
jgi:hypothetical protein